MIRLFSDIKNEVYRSMGIRPGDETTQLEDTVEMRINQVQDYIFFYRPWEWRRKSWWLTSRDPYETGTIAVTNQSRTITGTSTVWDYTHVGAELVYNSRLFKIDRRASGTSLILKANMDQPTASGQTYKIVFRNYALPAMCSSITDVIYEGKALIPTDKEHMNLIQSDGRPEQYYIGEVSEESFYSTGTIDVTNASASVTGTSTVFTSLMDGMRIRVRTYADDYTIRERTSDTAITLDRPYAGATASAVNFDVNPIGTPYLSFYPAPDDAYTYRIEGLTRPTRLDNANDISLVPDHTPLIMGAIWLCRIDLEDQNPVRIQQAKAEFEKSLKLLEEHYKVVPASRWMSKEELIARHNAITPQFNPLDSRRYL